MKKFDLILLLFTGCCFADDSTNAIASAFKETAESKESDAQMAQEVAAAMEATSIQCSVLWYSSPVFWTGSNEFGWYSEDMTASTDLFLQGQSQLAEGHTDFNHAQTLEMMEDPSAGEYYGKAEDHYVAAKAYFTMAESDADRAYDWCEHWQHTQNP